jgi:hypothetical protein
VPVRLEVADECFVEALLFVFVHREELQRGDEFPEVARGRGRDDQRSLRVKDAFDLRSVPRREDVEHHGGCARSHRQRAPHVARDRAGSGVSARRTAKCVLRDVEGKAAAVGQAFQYRREVVAGAGAEIDDAAGGSRAETLRLLSYFTRDRCIVARVQERPASSDHRGRVRGAGVGTTGQEADVSVTRDVERVVVRAPHGGPDEGHVAAAVRTYQELDHVTQHALLLGTVMHENRRSATVSVQIASEVCRVWPQHLSSSSCFVDNQEMRNVRAVLVPTAITWTAAVVLAAAWSLLSASPFVQRLGTVAIVLGALVMVGGSNAMSRGMEIESLAWAWGGKEDRGDRGTGGLTTVGFAVLVGGPLVVLGFTLASN